MYHTILCGFLSFNILINSIFVHSMSEPLLNDDGLDEVLEVESTPRKFPLASSSSLMYHPSIQPVIKKGLPVAIALAVILLIASNISIGTSVDLVVTGADGQQVTSANIYAFSLGSTLAEMYQAGVYFLMLLILLCSGVWPYVKLLTLLCCWMASTRRLPPVKREQILYLLDSLGKFSLIDAYVLVLMMVAFTYELDIGNVGAINVYTTPVSAFIICLWLHDEKYEPTCHHDFIRRSASTLSSLPPLCPSSLDISCYLCIERQSFQLYQFIPDATNRFLSIYLKTSMEEDWSN